MFSVPPSRGAEGVRPGSRCVEKARCRFPITVDVPDPPSLALPAADDDVHDDFTVAHAHKMLLDLH